MNRGRVGNQTNHLEHNPFPVIYKNKLSHLCKIYIFAHIFFFKLDVNKFQMYMFLFISFFSFFVILPTHTHINKTEKNLRPYFKLLRRTTLLLSLSPLHSGVPRRFALSTTDFL